MNKEKDSGRVLVELREIRKVEELLNVMRRVASGLERREEAEQVNKRSKVKREEESIESREHRRAGWKERGR